MVYYSDKSQEYLEWLKKGDFLLLETSYNQAIENGKKEFSVHRSGFEGSPKYLSHIIQFASKNKLYYEDMGDHFIFHIP
ncbi:hypothetical protein AB9M75_08020 [Lactobacillus sp. AN1001]